MLVVGPGSSVSEHLPTLIELIKRHQPIVICLNTYTVIPAELVTAYATCHNTRIMMACDRYRFLKRPLIIPRGLIPERVLSHLDGVELLDFGMTVKESEFKVANTGCILPSMLAAPYAFAVAYAGGAQRILLAGFDGYGAGDSRQLEMTGILNLCQKQYPGVPLVALTPTTYPVKQSSLYAPDLFPPSAKTQLNWPIRHVSFDKDGVLTDVHRYWAHTCRLRAERMIAEFGLAPSARALLLSGMGIDPDTMLIQSGGPVGYAPRSQVIAGARQALAELGTAASSEQLSDLFSAVDLHQQQERDYSISMLPDVKETLSALRKSGLKLSVYL